MRQGGSQHLSASPLRPVCLDSELLQGGAHAVPGRAQPTCTAGVQEAWAAVAGLQ